MPEDLTERPEPSAEVLQSLPDPGDLLIRELSRSLQLSGALFFRGCFTSPWAIRSTERDVFAGLVHPGATRAILFHAVLDGQLVVAMPDGSEERLDRGDVAIFPYADQHVMRGIDVAEPVRITDLLPPLPWRSLPELRHGGDGEMTSVACGYLFADDLDSHPILATMPALMAVRTRGTPLSDWLRTNLSYALDQARGRGWRSAPMARRLPELLFLECIAHYARETTDMRWAWIAAASDPVLGRALSLIHRHPADAWTLEQLARRAGSSRSVLGERFRDRLGASPMQYLTHWRLQLAAQALRHTDRGVAAIARDVGYGSESSFSRAFKRYAGVSPQQLRRGNR